MTMPKGAASDVYGIYYTLLDTVSGKEISLESEAYSKDSTYWVLAQMEIYFILQNLNL